MDWIRTSWNFGDPCALLYITHQDLMKLVKEGNGVAERLVKAMQADDPNQVEYEAYSMVRAFRPELKGGCLVGLSCQGYSFAWEFWWCDKSLPKREPGDSPQRIPLIGETSNPFIVPNP